jgi:hypothetical protein
VINEKQYLSFKPDLQRGESGATCGWNWSLSTFLLFVYRSTKFEYASSNCNISSATDVSNLPSIHRRALAIALNSLRRRTEVEGVEVKNHAF